MYLQINSEKNDKWGFEVKDLNINCKQKYPAAQ